MNNQRGFTLVEIIAVLIIISILAVIAVPKFINIGTGDKMATAVISELNTREKLTWMNIKLGNAVAEDTIDTAAFSAMDYNVGTGVSWTSGPGKGGGAISIDGTTTAIVRKPATTANPAVWSR